ncbi:fibrillin-3 isoform X2 [Bactrocera dorsalis]|uniref:Fibrillin-3 isoform X2 n=1 Tax=Bactrocera dorsalis TaxID=27457 RepID=A0ABM3JVP2_BACDO|nr:fibrillin-3 isoform X2 [Bactrocera dorsalis]
MAVRCQLVCLAIVALVGVSLARHEDCESAPYAEHSTVKIINEEDAVRAIYECEEGYELSGSNELICDVDSDLWDVEPPKCEKAGLSNEVNAERTKKKKPQNIIEDRHISAEMAASLDMTCVQAKITAPDIRHGFVQKYDRRRKGEHVFLVALYACNDNFELEDADITTLYCSQRKWVGDLPTCVALGEYTDADEEEYDEYEAVDDDEDEEDAAEESTDNRVAPPPPPPPAVAEVEENEQEISNEIETAAHENTALESESVAPTNTAPDAPVTDVNIVVAPTQDPYTPRYLDDNCGADKGGCEQKCERLLFPGENEPRLKCSCFDGFSLDPNDYASCHDINECELDNGGCEQLCNNLPGSYQCACEQGLQINTLTGNTCIDINECLLRNGHGPCQDTCHNEWRGYRCSCEGLAGTQLADDNHTCNDAGECANANGGCSHQCLSSMGRIYCLCPSGWLMSTDGKNCEDINECEQPEVAAQCAGGCENTHGSYRCIPALNTPENGAEATNEVEEVEEAVKEVDEVETKVESEPNAEEESEDDQGIRRISESGPICPAGYRAGGENSDNCVDIDECAEGTSGCEHCLNTDGSYECTCPGGYDLAEDERTCVDINECDVIVENEDDAAAAPTKLCTGGCENTIGSFICTCGANEHLLEDQRTCVADTCQDLNNPQLNKTRCAHQCVDLPSGVFECVCPAGYKLSDDLHNCVVAESVCTVAGGYESCAPGVCVPSEDNSAFSCECPSGYVFETNHCQDIDECANGMHECSHECFNNLGSYQCGCPLGFVFVEGSNEHVCADVDECAATPDVCGALNCVNKPGGYVCLCADGSEPEAESGACHIADPCEAHQCSHQCIAEGVGFKCICPEGMSLADDGLQCAYKDVCTEQNNGCEHICKSEEDGACACHSGYELAADGKSCMDVDECEIGNGGCHQVCKNFAGSYECGCEGGFQLGEDRRTCIDVDECALGRHDCSHDCVNVEGGYECICPEGYLLGENKATCLDVDECIASDHGCSHGCDNKLGSYECTCPVGHTLAADKRNCIATTPLEVDVRTDELDTLDTAIIDVCLRDNGGCSHICNPETGCSCPSGLELSVDGKTCVDIDECAYNNGGCAQLCHNTAGGFQCLCSDGVTPDDGVSCVTICPPGFAVSSVNPNQCVDIDECATPGVCQYSCLNTNGSYECVCPPGYALRNGRECEDVNECLLDNGGCVGGECINHIGSFQCKCSLGYRLASDRRTCERLLESRDQCTPFTAPANGDFHCTKYRHKRKHFYNTRCKVWCNQGYRLEGPTQRFCNASGQWDDFESRCLPTTCPRLHQPINGEIVPAACTASNAVIGERCQLRCQPGYVPIGLSVAICTAELTWSPNATFECVPLARSPLLPTLPVIGAQPRLPSVGVDDFFHRPILPQVRPPTGFGSSVASQRPYIKCPQNTTVFLADGATTAHIILQKPITNMDYRYIESAPAWTRNMQAHLGAGQHIVTFRGQDPISGRRARCRTIIKVERAVSPSVNFCTRSFEVSLSPNQLQRSVVWEEPRFESTLGPLKKLYKSRIPGELFKAGIHPVYYEATNKQGITARCEFQILVKEANSAASNSLSTFNPSYPTAVPAAQLAPAPLMRPPPPRGLQAKLLPGHESFVMCPGRAPVKVTDAQSVTLEYGCVLKNIRRGSPRRHAHRRLIATNWSDFTAF